MANRRKKTQHGISFEFEEGTSLKAFYDCPKRVVGILGSVGSGKTTVCIAKTLKNACNLPVIMESGKRMRRYKCAVIRNTYIELNSTVLSDFNDMLGHLGKVTKNPQTGYTFRINNKIVTPNDEFWLDAEWLFLAIDEEAKNQSLMGHQMTDAWMNEARALYESTYTTLKGRLRYPSKKMCGGKKAKHQIIFDSNFPYEDHWTYKLTGLATDENTGLIIPEKENAKVFIQPPAVFKKDGQWVINPDAENRKHLPDDYYEGQLADNVGDEKYIEVNLANKLNYYTDGKAVFPDYTHHLHYDGELMPDPNVPPIIGVDFGLTNPAVIFLQAYTNGRIIAASEIVVKDKSTQELCVLIKNHLYEFYRNKYNNALGDPSGKQKAPTDKKTSFDVMRANGINIRPAKTNNPKVRIDTVNQCLSKIIDGKPMLIVGKKCPMLHKALSGEYRYAFVRGTDNKRPHEKPEKNHASHIADALQYGLSEVRGADPTRKPDHMRKKKRKSGFWGSGRLY